MNPSTWRSPLTRGMSGADVAEWQGVLVESDLLDQADVDGDFGRKTEKATIAFQVSRKLKPDGSVGPATRAAIGTPPKGPIAAMEHPEIFDPRWRFLQAARCTRVNTPRTVTLVTMHTMQAPQKPDTAEGVAAWFAGARGAPPDASAHVCGDMDSIVQCVLPNDIAWGAQGGNSISYHCEQAGYAEWKREQWLEPNNRAMIRLMATHVRLALEHFGLPKVTLAEEEVASCVRDALVMQGKVKGTMSGVKGGICQHRQLTMVWQKWNKYGLPNPRAAVPKPWWPTHVDCGEGYPMDVLLGYVSAEPPIL